jgi:RHS repeat-associated protein
MAEMKPNGREKQGQRIGRRTFLKTAISAAVATGLSRFESAFASSNNWTVGNIVHLCAGTEIREGSGFGYSVHTIVPENDWAVKVIDGPRFIDGEVWWGIDRAAAGDPSGGTGWVYQSQADSCSSGGNGGGGFTWAVGEIVGLCAGTEIRHGPQLAVHTIVPEDNWAVKIIDGPRTVDGQTWWDTSRRAAGDPSGGTGWVSQQQAESSCGSGGGGSIGPLPLSPELRELLRMLGMPWQWMTGFSAADPVYPPTGNLIQQFTDLRVPGIAGFDLVLQRTYNSLDAREDGAFGAGWSSILDMSLRLANDGSVDVRYPDGHGVYFVAEGDAYVPGEDGIFDDLTYDGSGFKLITPNQITYQFDAEGALTAIQDRHGNTIAMERDGDGHVTRIMDSGDREYSLTYDGDHVASISDPSGRTISYQYSNDDLIGVTDGRGGIHRFEYENHQMTKATDPEGIVYLQNVYDGERRVIEQLDAGGSHSYFDYGSSQTLFTDNLGHQTRYTFDDLDRVTEVQDALGHTESYGYDDDYNLTARTDKRGSTWTYTYDDRGNRLTESGPLGWHVAYTYNETNDRTSVTDALGRKTTYTWESGNLVRVVRPDGTAFVYTYDSSGQRLSAKDPVGRTTSFTYNQHGDLVEVRSPLGCTTLHEHDIVGRVRKVTDANDHTSRLEVDANDNVTRITDPRGHNTVLEYNLNNSLVRKTDRRGGVWTYVYNESLRLVAETDPLGHTTAHAYDAMYNRVSTTDPRNSTTRFGYDALYRLVETKDALGHSTWHEHDANGNLVQIADALGHLTRLQYDELNRLVRVVDALDGVTEYQYDAVGHLVRRVNPRGAETHYEYDKVDRLIRVTDAFGGVTKYDYDDAGNLVAITDANGHVTRLRYDADNHLIERKDPEGHINAYEHDCVGNLVRLVNARGNPTSFGYDENDNPLLITDALGGQVRYTYDQENSRTSVTDPNGNTTIFICNLDGLLVQLIEAGGQETRFEHDAAHNLTRLINARGNAARLEYDKLNRRIVKTDPLGHTTGYAYDPLGRLVAKTDANSVITQYEYDPLNRLAAVVQNHHPGSPADHETNVRTAYAYDPVGNLVSVVDANLNGTLFAHDKLNRLIREVNPLGSTWHFEYDMVGNLARRIDANGASTGYTYDADDLLTAVRYPGGGQVTFAYDAAHNQVQMVDGLGTTGNAYDKLNRLVSSANHLGQAIGYTYDRAGNRTTVTYPDGRQVRYSFDANNRTERITDPDDGVFVAEYDPTHNITAIRYPNRTRALMAYDKADRLLSIVNEQLDGDVISSFVYALDALGNRIHADDYYRWQQPRTLSHGYVYDPLYRLVQSQDSEGRLTTYRFDPVGNRQQMTSNYDPLRTPTDVKKPYTVEYAYNAANQLLTTDHSVFGVTEYTYDTNGNRARRQGPDVWIGNAHDSLRTDHTYDYENRLTGVKNYFDPGNGKWRVRDESAMTYDGYGRLFRRMHDMHQGGGGQKRVDFVYDGLDPIAEYVEPSSQYDNYYRALGRILEMHEFKSQSSPKGTAYYYHHDGLGSVSVLTKHQGQSAYTYRYWDYGMALDVNDGTADSSNFTHPHNHYTYTGQNWDDHNALYHFYAREYDPLVGVWLQQDLYRGRLPEPMTLHRYGYVRQNSVNYADWYGFDRISGMDLGYAGSHTGIGKLGNMGYIDQCGNFVPGPRPTGFYIDSCGNLAHPDNVPSRSWSAPTAPGRDTAQPQSGTSPLEAIFKGMKAMAESAKQAVAKGKQAAKAVAGFLGLDRGHVYNLSEQTIVVLGDPIKKGDRATLKLGKNETSKQYLRDADAIRIGDGKWYKVGDHSVMFENGKPISVCFSLCFSGGREATQEENTNWEKVYEEEIQNENR